MSRERAYALSEEPGSFYADQFGSADVRAVYIPMGTEIAKQTFGRVDVICAGVGTGVALMGAIDGLGQAGMDIDVVALEPTQSPFLTSGVGGPPSRRGNWRWL